MTIDRTEITPEQYAAYKALTAGELNRTIENGLPEAILCGYGFYGASLEENKGKFYLLIKTGSSCD